MSVKWLRSARTDMVKLIEWHNTHAPEILSELAQKIWDSAQSLNKLPFRGRIGRVANTRELLVPDLSYILVYVVEDAKVSIIRLLHQHQNWTGELQ